jgi:fibronectin-binding autotransporter adhesin
MDKTYFPSALFGRRMSSRSFFLSATCLIVLLPYDAYADCSGTTGNVTCTGAISTLVGTGPRSTITTLTVAAGASIAASGTAISTGSGTTSSPNVINIAGSVSGSGQGQGLYATGPNVVEFGGNTVVNIASTGSILQLGGASNGEALNPTGGNNTINNYGTIKTATSAAMWFEGTDTATRNVPNTINNYGTITAGSSGRGTIIGNSSGTTVYFTNETGAVVNGNINLGNRANIVTLANGSTVNGNVSGGGNLAQLVLTGNTTTPDTLGGSVTNFGMLTKQGSGTWIIQNPMSNLSPTVGVDVNGGTLVLAGSSAVSGASIAINSGGTLQLGNGGTTGAISGNTVNNGALAFYRSDANLLFAGNITGSGTVIQRGSGNVTLTGTNSYGGGTEVVSGTLTGTATSFGASNSAVAVSDGAGLIIDQETADGTLANTITGQGTLTKTGPFSVTVTADNTYTGATTINAGTLQLGNGGVSGSISQTSAITNNAVLAINHSDGVTIAPAISGSGALNQIGAGTTTLTADNSYTGLTTISAGTLALTGSGGIAASSGVVDDGVFDISGTTDGADITTLSGNGLAHLGGQTLTLTSAADTFGGVADGTGGLTVSGGTEILTGANTYTGVTTIGSGATLRLGTGGSSGTIADSGGIVDDGSMVVDHSDTVALTQMISGMGSLTQAGTGTTVLSAANSYTGATNVDAGTLQVDGNQSTATGAATVASGATLSGTGTLGGDVTIGNGATLMPGDGPGTVGTLAVNGTLTLANGSILNWEFGQANTPGGAYNDLVNVGGNLTLGGTLNVAQTVGGSFDPGIYRIYNYAGSLTNNGLALGTVPAGSREVVQTSVAQQVNLAVLPTNGALNFWDGANIDGNHGANGVSGNGKVDGGSGTWTAPDSIGDGNWTTVSGSSNLPWAQSSFAVFQGAAGTVTVDDHTPDTTGSAHDVTFNGAQFDNADAASGAGYVVQGDALYAATGNTLIRVGDGTAEGANVTATINSVIDDSLVPGGTILTKADAGTLILGGANTFRGGTQIVGGVLQISADDNLGAAGTGVGIDGATLRAGADVTMGARTVTLGTYGGTFDLNGHALTPGGTITGAGGLTVLSGNAGASTLTLNIDNDYAGNTTIIGNGTTVPSHTVTVDATTANPFGAAGSTSAVALENGAIVNMTDAASGGEHAFTLASSALSFGGTSTAGASTIAVDAASTLALSGSASAGTSTTTNNGMVTFSGAADAGGATIVNAQGGTVDISAATTGTAIGSLSGAGNVNLGSSTLTEGGLNQNDTVSGIISGTGGTLTKTGTGILTLTGTNTYTGLTTINNGGTLQLGAGGTTGTIADTAAIVDDGTLAINHSDSVSLAQGISGLGSVTQIGVGTTILSGTNSYAGGTTVSSGTLVGSSQSFGSGAITDNAALVIDQGIDASLGNAIGGTGTLEKTGAGILTLTGTSSLSGDTTITQGGLAVSGSLAASVVTAQSGTVLSGTGTVGGVVANAGSTITTAANAVGTLSVTGNYQQNAGSTYAVGLVPGTNMSDLISIAGAATLANGSLLSVFKVEPGTYTLDTKYRVLTAAAGVSGTYALSGDVALSAFYTLGTAYDSKNVYLQVLQTRPLTDAGTTPNQIETAGGLQSLPHDDPTRNSVGSLQTDGQARQAFDALSGEIHASARTALVQDSFYVRDAAVERMRAADCAPGADSGMKVRHIRRRQDEEGACEGAGPAFWMQAYGSWGHNSGNGNGASMDHSAGGFVMGADTPVYQSNWHVGGLLGYGYSGFDTTARNSYGHSNNLTAGGYAGTHWGRLGLRLGATYTWNMLSTSRTAIFPGFADKLNSRYDGGTAQAFGDLGYRFDLGKSSVEPFADIAYVNLHTDRYREHGASAAAVRGGSTDTGVTYSTFGLRVAATVRSGTLLFIPNMMFGYRHAFGLTVPSVNQAFVSGGNDFSVSGVPLAQDAALVTLGTKVKVTDRVTLGVSYIGQYSNGYLDNGLRGTFSWIF